MDESIPFVVRENEPRLGPFVKLPSNWAPNLGAVNLRRPFGPLLSPPEDKLLHFYAFKGMFVVTTLLHFYEQKAKLLRNPHPMVEAYSYRTTPTRDHIIVLPSVQ